MVKIDRNLHKKDDIIVLSCCDRNFKSIVTRIQLLNNNVAKCLFSSEKRKISINVDVDII